MIPRLYFIKAVERFVTVGETIADDNHDIKQDMLSACKDARAAGSSIERLCEEIELSKKNIIYNSYFPQIGEVASLDPGYTQFDDRPLVRAARSLLGSVTRILLLADIVIVKQLLLTKEKVSRTLGRLESVATFTEFVKAFSIFGAEMVELAHITGTGKRYF